GEAIGLPITGVSCSRSAAPAEATGTPSASRNSPRKASRRGTTRTLRQGPGRWTDALVQVQRHFLFGDNRRFVAGRAERQFDRRRNRLVAFDLLVRLRALFEQQGERVAARVAGATPRDFDLLAADM